MGSLRLGLRDIRGYEAYLEGRVLELGTKAGRQRLDAEWKGLRRGWYVGGERFLEKLQEYLDGVMQGRQPESQGGEAKAAHDEAAAAAALAQALEVLGLREAELEPMPKSAPEQVVLAWWLRQRTTVPLRWLSEHLGMGHFTRVSQAISQVKRRPGRDHEKLKRLLSRMGRQQTAA
jgi:hypothetical protein